MEREISQARLSSNLPPGLGDGFQVSVANLGISYFLSFLRGRFQSWPALFLVGSDPLLGYGPQRPGAPLGVPDLIPQIQDRIITDLFLLSFSSIGPLGDNFLERAELARFFLVLQSHLPRQLESAGLNPWDRSGTIPRPSAPGGSSNKSLLPPCWKFEWPRKGTVLPAPGQDSSWPVQPDLKSRRGKTGSPQSARTGEAPFPYDSAS